MNNEEPFATELKLQRMCRWMCLLCAIATSIGVGMWILHISLRPLSNRFTDVRAYRSYLMEVQDDSTTDLLRLQSAKYLAQCILDVPINFSLDSYFDTAAYPQWYGFYLDKQNTPPGKSTDYILPEDIELEIKHGLVEFRLEHAAYRRLSIESKRKYHGDDLFGAPPYIIDSQTLQIQVQHHNDPNSLGPMEKLEWHIIEFLR